MLKYKKPSVKSAGVTAVNYALRMILKRMGIGKAFNILSQLNQKDGIDCPGCAWPDPDHRSKLGEFCENGVKAIAEEAMDTNEAFFGKHSVESLR